MAKYSAVNGVYRKVSKKYDPVEGVHRNVTKAFEPVDGVYRQYFSGGTPVGTLAVGESVWLNVDSTLTEFLVVHQGNPDSALYDASCDGTWLLMKELFAGNWYWDGTDNDYENSAIHEWLNNTILSKFDIRAVIKQVKIPYHKGVGKNGSVAYGSNGLSTKIFLLSGCEVGWDASEHYFPVDGVYLDYFNGMAVTDSRRIGYLNGTATLWELRSAYTMSNNTVWAVSKTGGRGTQTVTPMVNFRPAFILDSNTTVNQSNGINIIA